MSDSDPSRCIKLTPSPPLLMLSCPWDGRNTRCCVDAAVGRERGRKTAAASLHSSRKSATRGKPHRPSSMSDPSPARTVPTTAIDVSLIAGFQTLDMLHLQVEFSAAMVMKDSCTVANTSYGLFQILLNASDSVTYPIMPYSLRGCLGVGATRPHSASTTMTTAPGPTIIARDRKSVV